MTFKGCVPTAKWRVAVHGDLRLRFVLLRNWHPPFPKSKLNGLKTDF